MGSGGREEREILAHERDSPRVSLSNDKQINALN